MIKTLRSEGTFEIPSLQRRRPERYEQVVDIKGVTYYKDDNGLVQKTELDPKKVFTTVVKQDKHHTTMRKFAMLGLAERVCY